MATKSEAPYKINIPTGEDALKERFVYLERDGEAFGKSIEDPYLGPYNQGKKSGISNDELLFIIKNRVGDIPEPQMIEYIMTYAYWNNDKTLLNGISQLFIEQNLSYSEYIYNRYMSGCILAEPIKQAYLHIAYVSPPIAIAMSAIFRQSVSPYPSAEDQEEYKIEIVDILREFINNPTVPKDETKTAIRLIENRLKTIISNITDWNLTGLINDIESQELLSPIWYWAAESYSKDKKTWTPKNIVIGPGTTIEKMIINKKLIISAGDNRKIVNRGNFLSIIEDPKVNTVIYQHLYDMKKLGTEKIFTNMKFCGLNYGDNTIYETMLLMYFGNNITLSDLRGINNKQKQYMTRREEGSGDLEGTTIKNIYKITYGYGDLYPNRNTIMEIKNNVYS